ncbi:MAG: class II aldolase/adducin family protein, partial [Cyanobium sp.]
MPVHNRWSEAAAREAIAHYGSQGVAEPLALRTYSARLLGADSDLVLHGGGNTSVKTTATGLLGETIPVLCVKGSGWDLATIEPPGHPAVRLQPLQALRALESLSDEAMVAAQRQNLLDPASPNPSVEALLHAFLPHTFVDHTHSTALLALADQPDAAAVCREVYGDRVLLVPYVMPGFALAKACAAAWDDAITHQSPEQIEGMVLLQHGLFSFGETAEQSYSRMIELVRLAEERLRRGERSLHTVALPERPAAAASLLPVIRGALARAAHGAGCAKRWVLHLRATPLARAVSDDVRLPGWASRGVATPDHVIRTKAHPLVLPAPPAAAGPEGAAAPAELQRWQVEVEAALGAYVQEYQAYVSRQNTRVGGNKTPLDPLPRV